MKKVLSILSVLLIAFVLFACDGPVDGAEAKLQQAHDNLATLIPDPTNVTNSFQVPTELANGITATWSSNQAGVVTFASPTGGFANATVNRPAFGDNDAVVTITAVLSLKSELSDDILTKNWTLQITVKASTVAPLNIETIADVLALLDPAYDGGVYQVTIPNITIFAKADVAFGYDGTGIIQLYNSQTNFEVGKVYTITASLEWYFGIWELVQGLGVEDATATPQYPTKETITSVSAKINALTEAGEHAYANVPDGNFEPIYATVSGQVYMIPEDVSNYNTFLIETGTTTFVAGTTTTPANGLMFYYNTNDLAYVRSFAGFDVTMDVIIYTYRSNNLAFAVYYLGGPTGITADLTDEEAVEVTLLGLSVPSEITAATTITLPATGANNAAIVWSFKNAEDPNNALINLTTGAVTLPAEGQATVTLVATVTKGSETDTKEFVVKVGVLPVLTVAQALAVSSGTVRVLATVAGYIANDTIALYDETGAITAFSPTLDVELILLIGKKVDITGVRGAFNGLQQLTNYEFVEIGAGATAPAALDLSTIATWDATSLLPYQAQFVSASNLKVTAIIPNDFGNVNLTLLDELTLNTIRFFWDSRVALDSSTFIAGLQVGDYVSFNNALLGWANNLPLITITKGEQAVAGVAPVLTDAIKLALDKSGLTLPATATEDLTLPLGPLANGTTVTWSSSHPEIIANDGTFVAPSENTEVTLTATLQNGEEEDTKEFVINAIASDSTEVAVTAAYPADSGTTNMTAGNNAATLGLDAELFTVTSTPTGAATPLHVGLNNAGNIRLYFNATQSSVLTFTIAEGYKITAVKINYGATVGNNAVTLGEAVENIVGADVVNDSAEFTGLNISVFSIANTNATNVQVWITSIEITYDVAAEE